MRNGNIKERECLNETLDNLVHALCRDYPRRQQAIETGGAEHRTLVEFRYLNLKIMDAAAEIAGDAFAHVYINEIGKSVGYAKSETEGTSEYTYKKYKRLIKENIAKKLHLCD